MPSVSNATKTYNKAAQSPTIGAYDSAEISISDNSKTVVGNYSVKFNLTSTKNYVWSDGTTAQKTTDWQIKVLQLPKPSASKTTLTYSGNSQPLNVTNYKSSYMTVTGNTGTNVQSYTAVYKLSDKTNTQWSDSSTTDVSIAWNIEPLKLAKVTASKTSYDYTGSEITLEVSNYNSAYIDRSGTYKATTPNSNYTAVYSLKSTTNTKWSDGTMGSISINWEVKQQVMTIPTLKSTSLTYTGSQQTAEFNNYDSETMTISGNTGTNASTSYKATFALKDKTLTKWSDGTTSDKQVSWSIGKANVTIPTLKSGTITYDGSAQTAEFNNFDENKMTAADITKTDAGSYTAKFSLKDTTNYQWSDKTTAQKSVGWTISAKPMYSGNNKPQAKTGVTYTYNPNGDHKTELQLENYDKNTMQISGTTSATKAGTYTATVNPKNSNISGTPVEITWTVEKYKAQLYVNLSSWENVEVTGREAANHGGFYQPGAKIYVTDLYTYTDDDVAYAREQGGKVTRSFVLFANIALCTDVDYLLSATNSTWPTGLWTITSDNPDVTITNYIGTRRVNFAGTLTEFPGNSISRQATCTITSTIRDDNIEWLSTTFKVSFIARLEKK